MEEEADLAEVRRQLDAEAAAKVVKLEKDKAIFQQAMIFNDEQKRVKVGGLFRTSSRPTLILLLLHLLLFSASV
jgi:hypothetical protein